MTFWDTSLGHHVAEALTRNLPKIAESLNMITKPAKRTQHAETVHERNLVEYLNSEFEKGRVFVSVVHLAPDETGKRFLVITE